MKPAQITESVESGNVVAENGTAPSSSTIVASSPSGSRRPTNIRPVAKPVPQAQLDDPREFEISQVSRRYRPFRADIDSVTTLKFRLNPTDPDFPFELEDGLQCVLHIPAGYPRDGKPKLNVTNTEMARGFQINVEKGFDELTTEQPGKTLLNVLNALDRNLEKLLTSTKAPTVKIIANKRTEVPVPVVPEVKPEPLFSIPAFARYSDAQLQEAKARRDVELRQIEARLGRSGLFSKAGDGVAFNVPLQIPSQIQLSDNLRAVRDAALIVPEVYPLEPCTIVLRGVSGLEAENVEVAFEKRVVEKPELSLMAHINYLTQNIGKLSVDTRKKPTIEPRQEAEPEPEPDKEQTKLSASNDGSIFDPARPHLRLVARPPEWDQVYNRQVDESATSESESEISSDSEDETEDIVGGTLLPAMGAVVEKGIQLSFPGLSMTGIELLQIGRLSISARCNRCKEQTDFKGIDPSRQDTSHVRSEICSKCSATLTVSYRPELMHINSVKAGYLDVENCTVTDLLPSTFQPTCSECSTTFPSPPGIIAARTDSKFTNCRSCHMKMTFSVPEVKFLLVSTTMGESTLPLRPKKPKERLGISAGTPLPNNGRCEHYSKSYRWFRFSCCNKVFPCDKCHDSAATNPEQKDNPHPNEHADRMICGWCSREQRYNPEACRMCGQSVVKKVNTSGFWEGGKGTREKTLMRKKEGRKYKVSGREKKELESVKKRKEVKGKGGMWWPGESK